MSASNSPRVLRSTIGLKVAMALSGVLLFGFVLQHMFGNLQVFAGREAYNAYAHFMQGLGGIKWAARLGLVGVLALHVYAAIELSSRNRAARPRRYDVVKTQVSTLYSRTMLLSGLVVLAYLAYHLAHFTLEVVHYEPLFDEQGRRDVYVNFVRSFQDPVIALTYCVANVALALHLAHALSSMLRTLGLAQGRFKVPLSRVGPAFGLLIGAGNLAMPLACLLGVISP